MSSKAQVVNDHRWQHYLLCILFHMLFPLIPMGLEAGTTLMMTGEGSLALKTMALTLSLYAVSIGVSSRQPLQFGVMMSVSLLGSAVFGLITGVAAVEKELYFQDGLRWGMSLAMTGIFIAHARERYYIHVENSEEFWKMGFK